MKSLWPATTVLGCVCARGPTCCCCMLVVVATPTHTSWQTVCIRIGRFAAVVVGRVAVQLSD